MKTTSTFSALLLGAVAFAPPLMAQSSPPNVIPGKSLGKISLGMSASQVHRLLGKPDKTLRLKNGLLDDVYKAKKTRVNGNGQTVRDTIEVLYKEGKAIQLEATSPAFRTRSGLSTLSPLRDLDRALKPVPFLSRC